jgi:hypothetical protein
MCKWIHFKIIFLPNLVQLLIMLSFFLNFLRFIKLVVFTI